MTAPAVIFAVRLVGKSDVRFTLTYLEAERMSAGFHRDEVPCELFEVTVQSYRRIPTWGEGGHQCAG